MPAHDLLSSGLLHATAIVIVTLSIFQVAAYTGIVAFAAQRAALAPRLRLVLPLLVGASLAVWLAWAVLAVREPMVAPEPPPAGLPNLNLLLIMGILSSLGAAALFASKSIRALYAATPSAPLIAVHVYRAAGVMFLWPFLAASALPPLFALCAGIGDILTGLTAPFVALALARNRPGAHARAVAWNWFGLLDFTLAVGTAVISQSTNIARFPVVIIPLFVVPVGLLSHIYSLRNLAATRRLAPVEDMAGLEPKIAS